MKHILRLSTRCELRRALSLARSNQPARGLVLR
jgi:hypothetical protein